MILKDINDRSRRKIMGADVLALNVIGYIFVAVVALACFVPFIMVISASLTSEATFVKQGFSLFPRDFSIEAYHTIFVKPDIIGKAYLVTIMMTIIGTFIALFMTSMTAYVLRRKDFEWRNKFSFFFYFTTLFNGGLVPYYILMIRYLSLKNSYLALLLPAMFNVFNLLVMKSYMASIPDSLIEAAKIDGAGDFATYLRIIIPLSKPALASIGLFIALGYWNEWYNAMLFISKPTMYPLQYFLYQQLNNIEAYKRILASQSGVVSEAVVKSMSIPTQTLKMALTFVVTGPIIFAYPFVQKYFVQGITIGAVKG